MRPPGSHPYTQYVATERRYPWEWYGGAGGVMQSGITQSRIGGEARSLGALGIFDLEESGLNPYSLKYPPFNRTILHGRHPVHTGVDPLQPWAIGDWPLLRPAGPEPMDPNEGTSQLGIFDSLSDNEKTLAVVAIAGGVAWWLWCRHKKQRRRNPARGRYIVRSSSKGVTGSISFRTKGDAKSYAAYLRRAGKRATVSKR